MTIRTKKAIKIQEIEQLLSKNEFLLLVLTEQSYDRNYVIALQKKLPDCLVKEIKWLNKLYITPSISTSIVLEKINDFYKAIDLFDKTAHYLMYLMADTFKLNLEKSAELYDLKRNKSKNQRGLINNEWNYYFHGTSCSFTNSKTRQFLDVQINNGLQFGQLDTYYLLKFIQTTKSLNYLNSILNNDSKNLQKVIEILWINNYLKEIPDNINYKLIINRNKKPVAYKAPNLTFI